MHIKLSAPSQPQVVENHDGPLNPVPRKKEAFPGFSHLLVLLAYKASFLSHPNCSQSFSSFIHSTFDSVLRLSRLGGEGVSSKYQFLVAYNLHMRSILPSSSPA